MDEWVWSNGGMILTGENWFAGRKTLYSVGGRWMNGYGTMNGMARAWHGRVMASVNQTRPHCVNQMGKTHSKPLAARHGHGMLCVNRPLGCAREHICETGSALCRSPLTLVTSSCQSEILSENSRGPKCWLIHRRPLHVTSRLRDAVFAGRATPLFRGVCSPTSRRTVLEKADSSSVCQGISLNFA